MFPLTLRPPRGRSLPCTTHSTAARAASGHFSIHSFPFSFPFSFSDPQRPPPPRARAPLSIAGMRSGRFGPLTLKLLPLLFLRASICNPSPPSRHTRRLEPHCPCTVHFPAPLAIQRDSELDSALHFSNHEAAQARQSACTATLLEFGCDRERKLRVIAIQIHVSSGR